MFGAIRTWFRKLFTGLFLCLVKPLFMGLGDEELSAFGDVLQSAISPLQDRIEELTDKIRELERALEGRSYERVPPVLLRTPDFPPHSRDSSPTKSTDNDSSSSPSARVRKMLPVPDSPCQSRC